MNIERMSYRRIELERRAALHAALSDQARLRIVDTLSAGDASPSELAAMLDMPSNLLAHHLRILESERLITRTRSEGDKRRSYLRLVPASLDGLIPPALRPPSRVLFVCTANTARSQLAAALWRHASRVPVTSAGTHPGARADPGAIAVAARHRLPMRRVRPRAFADVRAEGDLVISVCDRAHEELQHRCDLHWSVPDPAGPGTTAAFDHAYDELTRRVHELAPRLRPASSSRPSSGRLA
jgi:ArsR family transcriptional regulator, arsenate/arsenite/antimonite-responsive transcriptional repressor / arsenate reductase (thioredoxin)